MAWASLVFDVVGVPAGRGVVCRVSCSRPFAWRHPTGFAGVSFATVTGLVVGLLACCLLVAVVVVDGVFHKSIRCRGRGCWSLIGLFWWPLSVSLGLAFPVFDDVGVVAGRVVGRGEGRCWPS